jgi:preprotein translocase subunit SecG
MLALQIVHLIIAALLVASILLQQRSSGLGEAFGGDSTVFSSRRGVEKILYYATIVFGISFGVLAILQLIIGD